MTDYAHKFEFGIFDQLIYFELDDNGDYRVMVDQAQLNNNFEFDTELLKVFRPG